MKSKRIPTNLIVLAFLTISVALALAAQDKYTVKVPNGLAFSEFRDTRPGRLSPSVRTEALLLRSSLIL
jgi:hypothetical protein